MGRAAWPGVKWRLNTHPAARAGSGMISHWSQDRFPRSNGAVSAWDDPQPIMAMPRKLLLVPPEATPTALSRSHWASSLLHTILWLILSLWPERLILCLTHDVSAAPSSSPVLEIRNVALTTGSFSCLCPSFPGVSHSAARATMPQEQQHPSVLGKSHLKTLWRASATHPPAFSTS